MDADAAIVSIFQIMGYNIIKLRREAPQASHEWKGLAGLPHRYTQILSRDWLGYHPSEVQARRVLTLIYVSPTPKNRIE